MKTTKFGELTKILRVKNHEILADMAKKLETTTPYLSAIENGRKSVPKGWIEKIQKEYMLSVPETEELTRAAYESRPVYKIECQLAGPKQRQAAALIAEGIYNLTDNDADKIIKILDKTKK